MYFRLCGYATPIAIHTRVAVKYQRRMYDSCTSKIDVHIVDEIVDVCLHSKQRKKKLSYH